jgi:hypothetical protein
MKDEGDDTMWTVEIVKFKSSGRNTIHVEEGLGVLNQLITWRSSSCVISRKTARDTFMMAYGKYRYRYERSIHRASRRTFCIYKSFSILLPSSCNNISLNLITKRTFSIPMAKKIMSLRREGLKSSYHLPIFRPASFKNHGQPVHGPG